MSTDHEQTEGEPKWVVQINASNTGSSRVIPGYSCLVAVHRGIERSGFQVNEITKIEVRRVQ